MIKDKQILKESDLSDMNNMLKEFIKVTDALVENGEDIEIVDDDEIEDSAEIENIHYKEEWTDFVKMLYKDFMSLVIKRMKQNGMFDMEKLFREINNIVAYSSMFNDIKGLADLIKVYKDKNYGPISKETENKFKVKR
jgi:hypothetical protein